MMPLRSTQLSRSAPQSRLLRAQARASFVDFMASMAHLAGPAQPPAPAPSVKSERERYLELPAVDMKTDLLEWWAENDIKFPALTPHS